MKDVKVSAALFQEFSCLLAQVLLRQTRTSSLQSTTFYLQQRYLPWSRHKAAWSRDYLRTLYTCLQFPWVNAACIFSDVHIWWCYAHFCCRGPAPRAGCAVSAQAATPAWSWSTYMHGDGIPSSQRPQSVKLQKKTPNGEVCLEPLISLHCRASLNSLLITGITH